MKPGAWRRLSPVLENGRALDAFSIHSSRDRAVDDHFTLSGGSDAPGRSECPNHTIHLVTNPENVLDIAVEDRVDSWLSLRPLSMNIAPPWSDHFNQETQCSGERERQAEGLSGWQCSAMPFHRVSLPKLPTPDTDAPSPVPNTSV